MREEMETPDGRKHIITSDDDLFVLLQDYAGDDVADYVIGRIEDLKDELNDIKGELEDVIDSNVTGSLKDGVFRDELQGLIVRAEELKDEMKEKAAELEKTLAKLDELIMENE